MKLTVRDDSALSAKGDTTIVFEYDTAGEIWHTLGVSELRKIEEFLYLAASHVRSALSRATFDDREFS